MESNPRLSSLFEIFFASLMLLSSPDLLVISSEKEYGTIITAYIVKEATSLPTFPQTQLLRESSSYFCDKTSAINFSVTKMNSLSQWQFREEYFNCK